jgi:DNA-binding MarR family transcriptional regulator
LQATDNDGADAAALDTRDTRDTRDVVGARLIQLGSRVHRLYMECLAALTTPLSVRQFRILDRVDHGNTSLGQLARLARRRPSTMSKSADSLVRQGLLTRTEDVEDRRIMVLALTPAGSALLGEAREAMSELARWLVSASGMDTASLAVFIDDFYEQTEHAMDNLGAPLPGWLADSAARLPLWANGENRDVRSAG